MKRRDFSVQLAASGLGLALAGAGTAHAQGAPVEGKNYIKLTTRAPLSLPGPDKKVEVVEFFGYYCPHCFAFESTLEAWVKKLPADVAFRRNPVAFSVPQQALQKAFYALEDMGQIDSMHRKLFVAIHQQNRRLNTDKEIAEFVASQGVDMAKFRDAFNSFSVNSRASRARQLSQDYKIDGVPTLGVQGRFNTTGSLTGGNDRMLQVVDHLIGLARRGA